MFLPKQVFNIALLILIIIIDREGVTQWDFDIWKQDLDGLTRCVIAMFEHFNLVKLFAIPLDRLVNFFHALAKTYKVRIPPFI